MQMEKLSKTLMSFQRCCQEWKESLSSVTPQNLLHVLFQVKWKICILHKIKCINTEAIYLQVIQILALTNLLYRDRESQRLLIQIRGQLFKASLA